MVKGVYILKSHLDAIVCLSSPMGLTGEKPATVPSPAELIIDRTPHDERVNNTIGERLRINGQMDCGLINPNVLPEKEPFYGEVKSAKLNGFTTDIPGRGFGGPPIGNRLFVNVPPTKIRNLRKALWDRLRDMEMLSKYKLHVRANDGVVTLSGLVETATQKAAAGKAAQSVPGVKKVINAIHVGALPVQTEQDTLPKENREYLH